MPLLSHLEQALMLKDFADVPPPVNRIANVHVIPHFCVSCGRYMYGDQLALEMIMSADGTYGNVAKLIIENVKHPNVKFPTRLCCRRSLAAVIMVTRADVSTTMFDKITLDAGHAHSIIRTTSIPVIVDATDATHESDLTDDNYHNLLNKLMSSIPQ